MYDDGSSDESRERLRKHEMSGYVHVRDWHHRGAQTEALNDCLCRYRHTARFAQSPIVFLVYLEGNTYTARRTWSALPCAFSCT